MDYMWAKSMNFCLIFKFQWSQKVKLQLTIRSYRNFLSQLKNPYQMTGFTPTREMGNLRAGNSTNVEANPSVSRLNNQISFSSGLSSCNGLIPKISEIRNENIGLHSPKDGNNGNSRCYISNFTTDSWSDSPFSGLKRMGADNDLKMFSGLNSLEAQVCV